VTLADIALELGSRDIDDRLVTMFKTGSPRAKSLIVRAHGHRDGASVAGVARVMESVAFGVDARRL
jgi:hypothetical protein